VSSAFLGFAGLYARDLGIAAWSLVLGAYGTTVVACRIAFARLPDRTPPRRLGAFALASLLLGLVVAAVVRQPAGLFAAAIVVGVGIAFLTPAVFALVMDHLPPGETASAAATLSIFIDLGLSAGPMALGLLAAGVGVPTGFGLFGVVPLLGLAGLVGRVPREG
jgi:MFS family permease